MTEIYETEINLVSEKTKIEGQVVFDRVTRVHGTIVGTVRAEDGSTLILGETAVVEGEIHGDTVIIDGFVQGNIEAKTRVVISRTGRVIGQIKANSLAVEFGAYFEGTKR